MTDASSQPRRLAIIGCGAAARLCHLPGLAAGSPFRLVALVDRVGAHAAAAAACYEQLRADRGLPADASLEVTDDLDRVLPAIDAAVVATANETHAEVAAALLQAGKHALVEKPLALSVGECDLLRQAAAAGRAVAAPAHVRRLYPSALWMKTRLEDGAVGPIRRVRWSQGQVFGWPVVSDFTFHSGHAGGGLLADMGPHVLDMFLFWFGQQLSVTSYRDNRAGGTESEVRIGLSLDGIPAEVELSRLRELDNRCIIEGERRTLRVGTRAAADYAEYDPAGRLLTAGPVPVLPPAQTSLEGLFREQLVQFDRAIAGTGSQLATFEEGVAAVRLLQACRTTRNGRREEKLLRPWEDTRPARRCPATRVAVTGATGFIGSHVVERLLSTPEGPDVVAVTRSLPRLTRLAHLLDHTRLCYASADIRDRRSLAEAFRGCDVVVHTVYGSTGEQVHQWSVSVEGTASVLAAAARSGVRRVLNISTMAVYEPTGRAVLDEGCPLRPVVPGDLSYAQQKLAAERLVTQAGGGPMEVVTVQPTIVYGPWGPKWTVSPLERLGAGDCLLPSGSDHGVCNAVHVHDVADAVVFLAGLPAADQLRLLVSGPEPVGWGTFYDAYRGLLGVPRPGRGAQAGPPTTSELYTTRVVVSTQRLGALGFHSRIGFAEGIAQVARWAKWAGLIPGLIPPGAREPGRAAHERPS